jgi:uncharacterized lipoprotein YmbA
MRRRLLLLLGPAAALAGCAGTPPRYYRLAALPGAVHSSTGQRIAVRNIGVPAGLSASGLPMPGGAYDANSFANDLWVAPLADMLQSTMVQNLAQRLPGDAVLAGGGSIGAPADVYVEINVFAFSPDASGNIALQAQLATRNVTGAQDWQLQKFAASAAGGTMPETIAAAMSTLWAQAADMVAGMV